MSDQSSKSKPTRPSIPSKKEKGTSTLRPAGPISSASSGDGGPEETQIPEPPPRGGQQPGEDFDKAPPSTSNS
jgi:hypothetical protein